MKPTALDMCLTGVPAEQLVHSEERGDHRCDPANHAQKKTYCTKMCDSWKIWFAVQWHKMREDAVYTIERRDARKEKENEQV